MKANATPKKILDHVCGAIDRLIEAGRAHGGLLPSLLDRSTGAMLAALLAEDPAGCPLPADYTAR